MDLKRNLLTTLLPRHIRLFTLWLILLLLLPKIAVSAQESAFSPLRCISKHVPDYTDISSFRLLSTELQPSIFIEKGQLNSYGTISLCLFTDIPSLSNWPAALSVSDVQLVQIKITNREELQQPIDLSRFSAYPNLKYIHILSEIDTTEASVLEIFKMRLLMQPCFLQSINRRNL